MKETFLLFKTHRKRPQLPVLILKKLKYPLEYANNIIRHHLEFSPDKRQLSHVTNDWTQEEELNYQHAVKKKLYELTGYIYDPEILNGICYDD